MCALADFFAPTKLHTCAEIRPLVEAALDAQATLNNPNAEKPAKDAAKAARAALTRRGGPLDTKGLNATKHARSLWDARLVDYPNVGPCVFESRICAP